MCRVPEYTAVVDADGGVRLCCILDSVVGNLNKDTWETIWTGEEANRVREKVRNGQEEQCQHCFRYRENLVSRGQTKELEEGLLELDLRTSNVCNCKCIMCSPGFSTQFTGQEISLEVEKVLDIVRGGKDTLRRIHFAGGEPLLHKSTYKVLEFLKTEGILGRLTLTYNTNATVRPSKELVEYWKQAGLVVVDLSIDAAGTLNDEIRVGSRWDRVQEVVNILQGLQESMNIQLWIHPTISVRNFGNIYELDQYASELKIPVRWGNVVDCPEELSIFGLETKEFQEKLQEEYQGAKTQEFLGFLDGIAKQYEEEVSSLFLGTDQNVSDSL